MGDEGDEDAQLLYQLGELFIGSAWCKLGG